MDHDFIFTCIDKYGYPTAVSVAVVIGVWKLGAVVSRIGERLISTYIAHVEESRAETKAQTMELKKQTVELREIKETLPSHCRATCPLVPGVTLTVSPEGK